LYSVCILTNENNVTEGRLNDLTARGHRQGKEMKRGYYACISYVDHMIGWLVDEVKAQRLYNDTTIVFWTDHGTTTACPSAAHPPIASSPEPEFIFI
jgi:arylsulfatase A-like enzyme